MQLVWRGLPAGDLDVEIVDDDHRPVGQARVTLDRPDRPGALVVDGLPAGAALTVRVRPPRPRPTEHLVVRTLDRLPGEELARIATVSDLHLGTEVFGHYGTITEPPHPAGPHPLRCARAARDDAVAWGAQRLVAKGDLTNQGRLDQWRTYASWVADTPIPVDAVPGNHDRDHPSGQVALAPEAAATVFGLSMAAPLLVRDLAGVRLVLVDSTIPGANNGQVAPVLADLLDTARDADPQAAVIVALHHQLHPRSGQEGWPGGIAHRDALDLLERLARVHPRTLVTSGHTHRHRRWAHRGVTTTQVGSTKDYPGVWAGYVVAEGGMTQIVRRVARPDCLEWTDHTRRAALGAWRFIGPGPRSSRCFNLVWPDVAPGG